MLNDVTGVKNAVKRRATFLSVVEHDAYNLLWSLNAPEKPTKKNFRAVIRCLDRTQAHFVTETLTNYDSNPYIECIFAFTALVHSTLCKDCSLRFCEKSD